MNKNRLAMQLIGGMVLAAAAQAVLAAPPPGRLLASQCAQCHGTNGSGGFDSLAGESAAGLYEDLLEMKYRSAPLGIMDRQARGYSDEQLWLVARFFAAMPDSDD